MRYLKTYESIFDFLKREENPNDKILDDLINVDIYNIEITQNKNTCRITCLKDGSKYEIIINDHSSEEFGPSTNCKFFINDKKVKASSSKIFRLYVDLCKKVDDFKKTIKKYNL